MIRSVTILPIGAFSTMCPHMCCYGTWLGKLSITNCAAEGFFPAVSSAMGCQVCRLAEWLVTQVTSKCYHQRKRNQTFSSPVRSLATMGSQVGLQGWGPCVTLATNSADIFSVRWRVRRRRGGERRNCPCHPVTIKVGQKHLTLLFQFSF